MRKRTALIQVRVRPNTHKQLAEIARSEDRTIASILRRALRKQLEIDDA